MRQYNPRYLIAATKIVARRENVTTRIHFQEGTGARCRMNLSLLQREDAFLQTAQNLSRSEGACVQVRDISSRSNCICANYAVKWPQKHDKCANSLLLCISFSPCVVLSWEALFPKEQRHIHLTACPFPVCSIGVRIEKDNEKKN